MKNKKCILSDIQSRGSILAELLLSVALAMMAIPFIFKYQQDAILRAENILIAQQMQNVNDALERYIMVNRENLMKTIGRNITRIDLSDLSDFGLDQGIIENDSDKYQVRILKSQDSNNQATLQGVVLYSSSDITPMRTRQLVSLGDNMGFVDGTSAYGGFGTWRADMVDMGLSANNGIIQTTPIKRDSSLYLWRIPSNDASDATMLSSLSLGGHDITNVKFFDIGFATFDEVLKSDAIASSNITFSNRTTIDSVFKTASASVVGAMSSDARNMDVSNKLTLSDLGKFSSFTTDDLYVSNLTLGGLSIGTTDDVATLKINDRLDMTYGRVNALYVSVGFAGSITPRLSVKSLVQDTSNPEYYWDADDGVANFADLSIPDLNTMARNVVSKMGGTDTVAYKVFSSVATNNNATVGDFWTALNDVKQRVGAKYKLLKLE